ncbi:MAG TPA: IS110 family transposase [Micromonosporaceae bacterium]|nr:IS110 family transposase [Micromonosporaceae bacterium]HCU51330.1 IS110 family transposase [Micromonosporaceae bacterium]
MSSVAYGSGFQRMIAGIDWAEGSHTVCVLDAGGDLLQRLTIPHSKAGISRLVALVTRYQVDAVGIERPDGPVVETLLAAGVTVFVIAPSQVKALRSRYGSAGNKDDRFDAFVLADTVRTDARRLTPLQRDSQATVALRQLCRARKDLVGHRIAIGNQLRAHLQIVLPGVIGLFWQLDTGVSRQFLTAFPTQDAVNALTVSDLAAWLTQNRYSGRKTADALYQHLTSAPAGPTGLAGQALAGITIAYLNALTVVAEQISSLEKQISDTLTAHPDGPVFTSLPRSGTVRAARLLAEIGDSRGRFPTAASLTGLAGVTPSTRQSGSTRIVTFRWAVDRQLRDAVCDFAADSRHANPWAAHLYQQARNRGHRHPHAVRILARAWLTIIWKCWTTNTPYDPSRHRQLQKLTGTRG